MNKKCLCLILLALFSLSLSAVPAADDEVLALERAALDRWQKGDVYGFVALAAEEITYFDPTLPAYIDGKKAFTAHLAASNGKFSIPRYEIINPRTSYMGDVAVLRFNLVNYSADNAVGSRWDSTEVYRKTEGQWKIIHSHWSLSHTLKDEGQ